MCLKTNYVRCGKPTSGFAGIAGPPALVLALVVGAALIIVWILSFQTHTYHHAEFMVRISIVPIGLGWAALVWQLTGRFE